MAGEQVNRHRIVVFAVDAVESETQISRNHRIAKTITLHGEKQ